MKPREFLNFFKTRSGRLTLFVIAFGGGLILFSTLRGKTSSDEDMDVPITRSQTNATDKPHVVQTIVRPMQPFYPPAPRPESSSTNSDARRAEADSGSHESATATLPPISLLADATAGAVESKSIGSVYAPFGRLISCETVFTVDSASIRTPIVGLVTENIYHGGKLVIPAGTEVHGTAETDRQRERIASGNSWTLVWQTGEELQLNALALDREFSGDGTGWGITDGSAGLRGRILKSDDMAEIKLFAATFLSGAAGALTEKQQSVFGPITSPSLANAPFEGAEKVLSLYAQRIYDAIQKDGFYVRVPSGKQFYLYVLQTIDRAEATVGGSETAFATESKSSATPAIPSVLPNPYPSFARPAITVPIQP